jgi:hypothetical protein
MVVEGSSFMPSGRNLTDPIPVAVSWFLSPKITVGRVEQGFISRVRKL